MRTLKLCTILGVLAALVVPAGAVTIPSVPNGYVFWEMNNHDNGTNYTGDAGTYTRDSATGTWVSTSGGTLESFAATGQWTTEEDTWGVFAVERLRKGSPIAPVSDIIGVADAYTTYYEWTASSDTGLVGMFYGGWDSEVVLNEDGSFAVRTEAVQLDLWAVDPDLLKLNMADTSQTTDFAGPAYEENRRDTESTYEDWVDSDDATKVLLLHAESSYFRFAGEFVNNAYFEGVSVAYWEVDPTLTDPVWNSAWGQSNIFTDPDGVTGADLWTDVTLTEDDVERYGPWLASTNDDGGAYVVPEPLTMLGLFLGVGSLGGYLRRRSRVA